MSFKRLREEAGSEYADAPQGVECRVQAQSFAQKQEAFQKAALELVPKSQVGAP